MDNKATTKRMIGAVVLVLVAALLLAALLRSKKQEAPNMAMDNASETKPILGFPGVSDEQKPSLVNENPDAVAQQNQEGSADQNAATAQTGMGAEQTQPEGQTVVNTTGFDVRPSTGGEARQVVDTDGKVKEDTGNMGGNEAVPSDKTAQTDEGQGQQVVIPPASSQTSSASNNDKPAEPEPVVEKKASKPVLVGERRVPNPPSAESAAKKAAAEKAAAEKAAAEKAAAAKSRELAASTSAGSSEAAASTGGFAVQVMASSDKAKADSVAGPLKADGHQVAVNKASVDGKVFYRVQITGFKTRADATNAQASMKRRYTQNQYVQNSFVTAN